MTCLGRKNYNNKNKLRGNTNDYDFDDEERKGDFGDDDMSHRMPTRCKYSVICIV